MHAKSSPKAGFKGGYFSVINTLSTNKYSQYITKTKHQLLFWFLSPKMLAVLLFYICFCTGNICPGVNFSFLLFLKAATIVGLVLKHLQMLHLIIFSKHFSL